MRGEYYLDTWGVLSSSLRVDTVSSLSSLFSLVVLLLLYQSIEFSQCRTW